LTFSLARRSQRGDIWFAAVIGRSACFRDDYAPNNPEMLAKPPAYSLAQGSSAEKQGKAKAQS
jgi:hypothetical protein